MERCAECFRPYVPFNSCKVEGDVNVSCQKVMMTHEAGKNEEGVTDKLLVAMSCVRESGIGCSLI